MDARSPCASETRHETRSCAPSAHLPGPSGREPGEDISAPRCFEIERKLKECCDIPIFHDDQHGTAVITLAGLTNALKVVGSGRRRSVW